MASFGRSVASRASTSNCRGVRLSASVRTRNRGQVPSRTDRACTLIRPHSTMRSEASRSRSVTRRERGPRPVPEQALLQARIDFARERDDRHAGMAQAQGVQGRQRNPRIGDDRERRRDATGGALEQLVLAGAFDLEGGRHRADELREPLVAQRVGSGDQRSHRFARYAGRPNRWSTDSAPVDRLEQGFRLGGRRNAELHRHISRQRR